MARIHVHVDTNVAIDRLNDRKPWSDEAKPLWDSCDAGLTDLYLAASVLTDVFYILRKPLGNDGAKRAVERCLTTCGLLPIDEGVIRKALSLSGSDFEDNVQIACTQIYPIDLIVTRNLGDFIHGVTIPVIKPKGILSYLPPARP
jgi:predicted nucleic acid-binding protein